MQRDFVSMRGRNLIQTLGLLIHTHGDSDGISYWNLPDGCRLTLFSSIPIGVVSINDLHTVDNLSKMFIDFLKSSLNQSITNEIFTEKVLEFQYNYVSYYVEYFISEIIKLLLTNKMDLDEMYAKPKRSKGDVTNIEAKIQYLIDLTRLVDIIQNQPELLMVCRVFNGGDKVLRKNYSSNHKLLMEANKEFVDINTNWQVTIVPTGQIMSNSLVPLEHSEEEQTNKLKAETIAAYAKVSEEAVQVAVKATQKGVKVPKNPVPAIDRVAVTKSYVHTLPGVDDLSTSGFEADEIIINQYAIKIADRTTTAHHISFTNEHLFKFFFEKSFRFLCVMDNSCLEIKRGEKLVTDWHAIIAMRETELEISPTAYRMHPSNIIKIQGKIDEYKYLYNGDNYTVKTLMVKILSDLNYGSRICKESGVGPCAFASPDISNEKMGSNEDIVLAEANEKMGSNEDIVLAEAPMVVEDIVVAEAPMVVEDIVVAPMVVEDLVVAPVRKRKLDDLEGGRRKRKSKKQKGSKRNKKFRKTYKKRRHERKTRKR